MRLPFVDYSLHLTGHAFLGLLAFSVICFVILWGTVSLFGTKLEPLGWFLLAVILISALPIFDYTKIFI